MTGAEKLVAWMRAVEDRSADVHINPAGQVVVTFYRDSGIYVATGFGTTLDEAVGDAFSAHVNLGGEQ